MAFDFLDSTALVLLTYMKARHAASADAVFEQLILRERRADGHLGLIVSGELAAAAMLQSM